MIISHNWTMCCRHRSSQDTREEGSSSKRLMRRFLCAIKKIHANHRWHPANQTLADRKQQQKPFSL